MLTGVPNRNPEALSMSAALPGSGFFFFSSLAFKGGADAQPTLRPPVKMPTPHRAVPG